MTPHLQTLTPCLTTDGGDHWTELNDSNGKGLPEKPWGRVALAVAPSKPQVVYANIESKKSALFRSDDGGKNWKRLDASRFMIWRPFYFGNLIVDSKDPHKIFKPDGPLLLSVNGGQSFSVVSSAAHGDFHDVWINPENPNIVYTGDDGGLWRSEDGGTRWKHQLNLPVSQFYHVSVDMADPYHVYGGLQDNSAWVGDSSYPGGVTNSRWENMYNGDGFWMFEDPADSAYIYAELQGGELGRVNRYTHEVRPIQPLPLYKEKKLHFNWNTPIHMSPNEKGTIYIGAQFLFRSRDHGQTWERISPDLTTNDPEKQKQEESGGVTIDNSAAEMHTSISGLGDYLAEDDRDALRIARDIMANLEWDRPKPAEATFKPPRYDAEELLGIMPMDHKRPVDMRQAIARFVDDSDFTEFGANYGSATVCGHARIEGQAIGIITNNGPLDVPGANKATHFIQACCQSRTPLLYLNNTTGYMVGKAYEEAGMIKHGSKMIQAVTSATVPQITIYCGASFGAGNYGMCGRGFHPRFCFSWPNAKTAVMGGEQAAETMAIVTEAAAARRGKPVEKEKLDAMKAQITGVFDGQMDVFSTSARVLDDGVIDPRDTRGVLAEVLAICREAEARTPQRMQFSVARP